MRKLHKKSHTDPIAAISLLLITGCIPWNTQAFTQPFVSPKSPVQTNNMVTRDYRQKRIVQQRKEQQSKSWSLNMSNNNNKFDLTKPTFDLFAFRSVRYDALQQYNTLNQSEPLRINLYLFFTLTFFSLPTINESIGLFADGVNTPISTALSVIGGIGCAFLFFRENGFRNKQLVRMEKELNAENLTVKLPTNNKLNPRLYAGQPSVRLKDLRQERRVVAICGPSAQLKDVMVDVRVLRRRLVQSRALVVLINTDGSSIDDNEGFEDWGVGEGEVRAGPWLGMLQDKSKWLDYFAALTNDDGESGDSSSSSTKDGLVWFGLNYSGRSFASGVGKPRLLEIMGQYLRPADFLDLDDEPEPTVGLDDDTRRTVEELLGRQEKFYTSLTGGDLEDMQNVVASYDAAEVTAVIDNGGRVDGWKSCLADGARPAEMKTSGSDVLILSPTTAYSTTIEFPVPSDRYGASSGRELLAVQRWGRAAAGDEWKMEYHQTIPWSTESKAGGTLRCDGRGCVALTSQTETRLSGRRLR